MEIHTILEKILSVSHYSVIANIVQRSTHFNMSPAVSFSPGGVSLGGEHFVRNTRGRTALTYFKTTPSSLADSLYVAGVASKVYPEY